MILQHRVTKNKMTLTREDYYKFFYTNPDYVNVTPERTQKQVEVAKRFVLLGKLSRTKTNLEDVYRSIESPNRILQQAVNILDLLIKETKK